MLKKILLRLLCVLTLISFILPVYATNSTSTVVLPTNTLQGEGTTDEPWQISNCLDLASLHQAKYFSTLAHPSSFILTNDIDCSDTINWNDGNGFPALAPQIMYAPYEGVGAPPEHYFDGNNHTITGLYKSWDGEENGYGIFPFIGIGATVKNLKIENATLKNIGAADPEVHNGLLSLFNLGTIENVSVNGTIEAKGTSGMLASVNAGVIKESSASGSIISEGGDGDHLGGLVGDASSLNLYNITETRISNSYSTVSLITTNPGTNALCGGLVGSAQDIYSGDSGPSLSFIQNSYANSLINCSNSTGSYSGGLIGRATQTGLTIENSFSTSQITSAVGTTTGGFIGGNSLYSGFNNSFYDSNLSGQNICSVPNTNACVAISDSNYFKNNSLNEPFTSWDFNDVWETNSSYPIHKAQINYEQLPINFAGTPSVDKVDLTWEAPTDPDVQVVDYAVYYKGLLDVQWILVNDGISTATNASVTSLTAGTPYLFKVRALDAQGNGKYSYTINITTTTPPGTTLATRGDGGIDTPWQISTCEELQELNDPKYEYNLSSPFNYVLVNDIDCTNLVNSNPSTGFVPIKQTVLAPDYSFGQAAINPQYFDGRNHTITGLTIKSSGPRVGLFESIGPLTTVKNLKIKNTNIFGDNLIFAHTGTVAATIDGTLENVEVLSSTISTKNNSGSTGGLVGSNYGHIIRSSTTGTINKNVGQSGNLGGLVGINYEGTIDNSFSTMDIFEGGTAKWNDCGGLVGDMNSGSIDHSYATGRMYCTTTIYNRAGSVAGEAFVNTISNTFGTGLVYNTGGDRKGGFVGSMMATGNFPNSYFDMGRTQMGICAPSPYQQVCNGVNLFNLDSLYFFNNSTNAPYNTWDFVNVWHTTNTYPLLNEVNTTPDSPTNLLGTTALTTADLTWDAPIFNGGSPISDYEIQYKKSTDNNWSVFNDGVSTNEFTTVTGLEEGVVYDYRVRAINSVGIGLYSYARTEIQLQTSIESPIATEFEYGEGIDYSVSIYNTSSNPIDSIDTSFLSSSFDIDSITLGTGSLGTPPSDVGVVTNSQNWSGLLEPNQELVFDVHGTVSALPNETGKLNFTGTSLKFQGNVIDLGPDETSIRAESMSFIVKETATNFEIDTTLRETGVIDQGDQVHLTYSILNRGPKAGFFTNAVVYIYIPASINVTQIENDFLICSNTVLIDQNLSSGIYANLQGQVFAQCSGTGGKISNVNESITIEVTGTATQNFNFGDVISRSMFISAQDQDTVELGEALANPPTGQDLFSMDNDNVDRLVYEVTRPAPENPGNITTTTVVNNNGGGSGDTGGSGNNSGSNNSGINGSTSNTPSSKDSITTNKSGAASNGVVIKNKIIESTSSSTSKLNSQEENGSFDNIPEVKTFIDESVKALEKNEKKLALSGYKSKQNSPFQLLWLAGGIFVSLVAIGIRQTLMVRKASKIYNS